MKVRILKPEEYGRLDDAEHLQIWPYVNPADTVVVAVENNEGRIVGQMTVTKMTHFESVWIAPEYRGNPAVVRALLGESILVAEATGVKWVVCGAEDGNERMESYLRRLHGAPLPARFYAVPIRGRA